ncbi:uncharacterized protein LOC116260947 [Nymphaea colorata]|nr:uncharacterized protein LOC116260947 [Nymphaea colorata]
MRPFLLFILYGLAIGIAAAAPYEIPPNCKSLECPSYDVVDSQNEFEIRHYRSPVWMSTQPIRTTSYTVGSNEGFTTLFSYIQGNNQDNARIEMTAPVLVDVSPSSYVVSFYVPQKFQARPPLSAEAHAVRWPGSRYAAVRRFGGFMNDANIAVEADALKKGLQGTRWAFVAPGSPATYTVAGYNSPFEFDNRVNEVMFIFERE